MSISMIDNVLVNIMYYLKLILAGVLQSYGTGDSRWAIFHDTEMLPTQSAVMGIIGCAMGIRKTDEKYQDLANCRYLCLSHQMPHKLTDYQIVAPREYKKNVVDSKFWNANGSHTGEQLPIYKSYLTNAEFTVYVGSENQYFLKEIYNSLRNPKWAYFLGRACCTPSKPVAEEIYTVYSEDDIVNLEGIKPCIYA